ncbi:LysR family transcriptional regulator [Anaerovibrio slackiae]|uniref:LysR family transcriptional regulator n=1 Tax=Anaerovibrio slackiae TaxID=2652309 RepID=UPI00386A6E84
MYNRELITFITVADQGSFLKAAKQLYITPASVMNQMNKLESMIGVKLVERTNQGIYLTSSGRSIYQDAKNLIEFADEAIKKARQLATSEQNMIRVGTSIMRPCKRLIDLLTKIDDGNLPFQIRIVPFDDDPAGLDSVLSALGNQIDCFVSPCNSTEWQKQYSIFLLSELPCRIAVPRKHRLSKKESLCWSDLDGETFMVLRRGDSSVLNQIRDDILENHPQIRIADVPNFYDTSIFNECEQMNYVMETLDIWADIHPSLITLPMEWEYKISYGIVYAKNPSKSVKDFIKIVKDRLSN